MTIKWSIWNAYPLFHKKVGRTKTVNGIETRSPPIDPIDSENQNISFCPPIKNGTKPKQVEKVVKRIGNILPATALITALL